MARPPKQPERTKFTEPRDLDAYDKLPTWRAGAEAGSYFGALLNSPPFALNRAQLSSLIRTAGEYEGTYSHAEREMVDQTLSALFKSNHFLSMHVGDALAAGVRLELIEAIRNGRDKDLDDHERLLVTYIRQVATGTVTDQIFEAVQMHLGTRGIVEYTVLITTLLMTMRQMQAFGCPQMSDEEVDAMIRSFREGTTKPPDFRVRIR